MICFPCPRPPAWACSFRSASQPTLPPSPPVLIFLSSLPSRSNLLLATAFLPSLDTPLPPSPGTPGEGRGEGSFVGVVNVITARRKTLSAVGSASVDVSSPRQRRGIVARHLKCRVRKRNPTSP